MNFVDLNLDFRSVFLFCQMSVRSIDLLGDKISILISNSHFHPNFGQVFIYIFFIFRFLNQLWFVPLAYQSDHLAETGSPLGGAETVRRLVPLFYRTYIVTLSHFAFTDCALNHTFHLCLMCSSQKNAAPRHKMVMKKS
jgi:hypothetical protein